MYLKSRGGCPANTYSWPPYSRFIGTTSPSNRWESQRRNFGFYYPSLYLLPIKKCAILKPAYSISVDLRCVMKGNKRYCCSSCTTSFFNSDTRATKFETLSADGHTITTSHTGLMRENDSFRSAFILISSIQFWSQNKIKCVRLEPKTYLFFFNGGPTFFLLDLQVFFLFISCENSVSQTHKSSFFLMKQMSFCLIDW